MALVEDNREINFASIPEAVEDIRNGKYVIVMDDESRENEGDLIMAAKFATPEKVAFFVNYTTGILCAPMSLTRANELQLPIMVHAGTDPNQTAYTITTDSKDTSTGVSASDRTITFNQLADPAKKASSFRRPGHVFPLIARPDGVLERNGHTEAAVDLCKLAGVFPVGIIGEIVNKDGTMKRLKDCAVFGEKYGIKLITIENMIRYRLEQQDIVEKPTSIIPKLIPKSTTKDVELVAQCELPITLHGTDLGNWTLKCFYCHIDGCHHISVERGDITREPYDPVLTHVHSECFTGDILGSRYCDCGEQLFKSLQLIAARGRGVLIYNVGHEGRGIGLANKILAYHLQQTNSMDTYTTNQMLGFQDDVRKYDVSRAIIKALGIEKVHLLTSNLKHLSKFSHLAVSILPLDGTLNVYNTAYLDTKGKKHESPSLLSSGSVISEPTSPKSVSLASEMFITPVKLEKPTYIKFVPINLPVPCISNELKIGIVRTSWNEYLVGLLTERIKQNLLDGKIHSDNITEVLVPRSFEIPWTAKILAPECDAVICIGLLIKGETMHFEMVSQSVAQGLLNLQLESGVPIINCVLNCLTEGEAEARCGPDTIISPCARWNTTGVTVAGGVKGNLSDQLDGPEGIFVYKPLNRLYVADFNNQRIQVFLLNQSSRTAVTVASNVTFPSNVYVDDDGNSEPTVYAALYKSDRVNQWVNGSKEAVQLGGECRSCTGIAVDNEKNVYMSEPTRHRVLKWSRRTNTTTIIAGQTDQPGSMSNQLRRPQGIHIDRTHGTLYVADSDNNRVQKWLKDAQDGVTRAGSSLGVAGNDSASFSDPISVTVDEVTYILYVADFNNRRIQRWLPNATEGETIAQGSSMFSASKSLIGVFSKEN
ncbi:unnamed protein product [Rotaria sordida]|uniref:GTP cyclohydrolase II domain-containing protein n=1 Tax=Rotaria sordida TaxID=392033 RepID=A0A815BDG8_9BILA|nr:unnamed protein product [Rotaria sordida]